MRTAFFGTPDFAVPCLRTLAASTDVVVVVTGHDARQGRGRRVAAPPVKTAALELGLQVRQPWSIRDLEFLDEMAGLDLDLGVVVAYGRILGRRLLRLPHLQFVNVHASVLPRLRGAAPIQRALIEGHSSTGVSIMQMELGLDSGPVFFTRETPIEPTETAGTLHDRLAVLGADALADFLVHAAKGALPHSRPQDHDRASYAEKITAADEWLDWRLPVWRLACLVRGLAPRPGACTTFRGLRVRVLHAEPLQPAPSSAVANPGSLVLAADGMVLVGCGDGWLRLSTLQMQGKSPVAARDFCNGYHVSDGDRFVTPAEGTAP